MVLIPGKQTADFTVSFGDYPDSRSTLGLPIPFETCVHMLKCQKMSRQSKQHKHCIVDRTAAPQRMQNTHGVSGGTVGDVRAGNTKIIVSVPFMSVQPSILCQMFTLKLKFAFILWHSFRLHTNTKYKLLGNQMYTFYNSYCEEVRHVIIPSIIYFLLL